MKYPLIVFFYAWSLFAAATAVSSGESTQIPYTRAGTPIGLSRELALKIAKLLHARSADGLVFYDTDAAYPWLKNGKIFTATNWNRMERLQVYVGPANQAVIKGPEGLSLVLSSSGVLPQPLEIADLIAWSVIQSPSMVVQPLFFDGPCWKEAKLQDRLGLEQALRKGIEFTLITDTSWRLEFNVVRGDGGCEHVSVCGQLQPIVITKLRRTVLAESGSFPNLNGNDLKGIISPDEISK